jgi:hypothetical protein
MCVYNANYCNLILELCGLSLTIRNKLFVNINGFDFELKKITVKLLIWISSRKRSEPNESNWTVLELQTSKTWVESLCWIQATFYVEPI